MKRIRTPCLQLYFLAKKEKYDPISWKELLVGAFRKVGSKSTVKEICLFFYALSKASKQNAIKSLTFACKNKDEGSKTVNLNVKDVTEAYVDRLLSLINYMNSSQLAMVSRSLGAIDRLDTHICGTIINRIKCSNINFSSRSMSSLVLTLARSGLVDRDMLGTLIMDRMDVLRQANKLDTLDLCKAMAVADIRGDALLKLINDKLDEYCDTLSPKELLEALNWLYRMESKELKLLQKVQNLIRVHIEKYDLKDLCTISKAVVKLIPEGSRDLLVVMINPIISKMISTDNVGDTKEHVLQYYLAVSFANCEVPLKPLISIVETLDGPSDWGLFFKVLQRYHCNMGLPSTKYKEEISSLGNIRVNNDLSEAHVCLKTGLDKFVDWLEQHPEGIRIVPQVTKTLMNSSGCSKEFMEKLLKIVLNVINCPNDVLVDIMYNIHTLPGFDFLRIMEKISDLGEEHNVENCIKILSIQFYLNMSITQSYKFRVSTWIDGDTNEKINQKENWQLPDMNHMKVQQLKEADSRLIRQNYVEDEVLCYFLASIVLFGKAGDRCDSYEILKNSMHDSKARLWEHKEIILSLVRKLKSDCIWVQRVLTCISLLEASILEEILNSCTPPIEVVKNIYALHESGDVSVSGVEMKKIIIQSQKLSSTAHTLKMAVIDGMRCGSESYP
ncbi:hypothetical protein BgAZ_304240 [Babesia gibsoni]|uniref:Uncharacterized protein n=1 Tax=Babesia gibsoni TaxID=33632 RepID=A0AAD8PDZ2_BABGI|nr:hypothetical protein BgAZ_304240 [Babesia gibsoni]